MNLQTAAQHAELLRRVETLNLLQDSNKLMREEKQRTTQQLRDLDAKVSTTSAAGNNIEYKELKIIIFRVIRIFWDAKYGL